MSSEYQRFVLMRQNEEDVENDDSSLVQHISPKRQFKEL